MKRLLMIALATLSLASAASAQSAVVLLGKDTLKVELHKAPVAPIHDTVKVTVPGPAVHDTVRIGVAIGAWATPAETLGTVSNYTTVKAMPGMLNELAKVKARHAVASLVLPRVATNDTTKKDVYSVAKVKAWLATLPDVTPYIRSGTINDIMVADDITNDREFGPGAPYFAQIDSVAQMVRAKWPGIVPAARALPSVLAAYKWKYLRAGWAQYVAGNRYGPIEGYITKESAAAKASNLCLVLGLNFTKGGDGSSGIGTGNGFTGNVPQYEMSAEEVAIYGAKILVAIKANPSLYMPIVPGWEYREPQNTRQQPGLKRLRAYADNVPSPRCV
jgi:hypothetical protein